MNRLRNRLILVFLAAILAPLAATVWFTTTLLEPTMFLRAADQVDRLSTLLRQTTREFYRDACADLKRQAQTGEAQPRKYAPTDRAAWPEAVKDRKSVV